MPPAPMDINEWWLAAAAATSILTPAATAQAATTQPGSQVGIATAVRPGVTTATNDRVIYIGNSVAFGERFKTDSTGVIHILFMDQSSMTLGPNSELVIDEFVFNPDSRRGSIAVNLVKGALRVVGGFISKFNNPQGNSAARVQTATATIGIRGGISVVEHNSDSNNTNAAFLFGQQMQVTGSNGQILNITRPGFGTSIGPNGIPGNPFRTPTNFLNNMMQQFGNGPAGGQPPGGAPSGPLISTNGNPIGNNPNTGLAPDRTQQSRSQVNTQTPQSSLRNLLGSSPTTNQS
ncbi:MAG: FecR domain-containing protein [Burkholderiales bacterium]|nr:FecR domain-containing protein [Burkholderiales bacterium]